MALLHNELARWKNGQLELRPQPLRVKWTFDDVVTGDGHALRLTFSCSVAALPDPTEQKMLREVLLEWRNSVTDETIVAHFTPALRAAADRIAESRTVATMLDDEGKRALADALKTAGNAVAFACGVEMVPPLLVEAESPTLRQQRLHAVQRSLAEQQAAGQMEHLQRAGDLLKQFQSIRQNAPELSAGQVLQQISPTDRGRVLQTLLLASAKKSATGGGEGLWAVAGTSLVKVVGGDGDAYRLELTELPEAVGPLRSVQAADVGGERVLLVGARSGFLLVRPDATDEVEIYSDPDLESALGFSRVVYWPARESFVGCHGDGGIVRWARGETYRPAEVVRTAELQPSHAAPAPPARATSRSSTPTASCSASGRSFAHTVPKASSTCRANPRPTSSRSCPTSGGCRPSTKTARSASATGRPLRR